VLAAGRVVLGGAARVVLGGAGFLFSEVYERKERNLELIENDNTR